MRTNRVRGLLGWPKRLVGFVGAILLTFPLWAEALPGQPELRKRGIAQQLFVDGEPFLIIGGELHNSSSSSLAYMAPIWKHMQELNANTVLAGLNWELIEPQEGHFDFALVDGLIQGAREHDLRLVFLWFGSWKNGMSSYVPLWVKSNPQRFPRVVLKNGEKREVLTPLGEANWKADAAAFAALMRHIREVDGKQHTVLMMQVENEAGILNDSRDRSPLAEESFTSPVPRELMEHFRKHRNQLEPEIRTRWEAAGAKTAGTWEAVFGPGPETDEFFMAWHYARYIDQVARAGKAEYGIPMYANAWLAEADRQPGSFPSGGPLPYDLDAWRVGAPHLDLLAPDIYAPTFDAWCRRYTSQGNPLFIPETKSSGQGPRNLLVALGEFNAIGTSPFGVDSIQNPKDSDLARSHALISQIAPLLLAHQGKGETAGFVLDETQPKITRELGGYELEISLDALFGHTAESGYGLIVATGPNEFLGVGMGFRVAFKPKTPGPVRAGIARVDEGEYRDGIWIPGRRLNGDENDQGNYWRFDGRRTHLERCAVYRWE